MDKRPQLVAICDGKVTDTLQNREQTMQDFYNDMAIDVLARTMWGEARGQGTDGLSAVACVVLNRVKVAHEHGTYWWGNNIIQVCQKPYQFSCWNRSDTNFKKLQYVGADNVYFASCLRIARRAVIGVLDDNTNGATHYHADYVSPYWARGKQPCAEIGAHLFYKLVEG